MKKLIFLSVLTFVLTGCDFDNYEPPESTLTGTIVYDGSPVGVRHGINVVQLYEPGWDNFSPIAVNLKQDGTFSSLLFEGNYKLVLIEGNGPWVDVTDTIDIQVRGGKTTIDVPVEPFFWISNVDYKLEGTTLSASFNLQQIVENMDLEYVSLYLGETFLVDNIDKVKEGKKGAAAVGALDGPVNLQVDLSDVSKDYVFARIGVKIKGSSELIFSQVQKIQL